jgi:hypothetical protein
MNDWSNCKQFLITCCFTECRGTAGDGYSVKGPFATKNTGIIMPGQITSGLRTEPMAGFCDYGNGLRDSHKTGTSLSMK